MTRFAKLTLAFAVPLSVVVAIPTVVALTYTMPTRDAEALLLPSIAGTSIGCLIVAAAIAWAINRNRPTKP